MILHVQDRRNEEREDAHTHAHAADDDVPDLHRRRRRNRPYRFARRLIYAFVTSNVPSQLATLLAKHDHAIQALALALRDLVLEELTPCHEYAFLMRSKIVLLYGATTHVIEDNICNIALLRRHVTLTFRHGAELHDPRALLRGTGKIMRHVRIERLEDLERAELRDLIREARRHAESEGLAPLRGTDRTVITRVKERKPTRQRT